MEETEDLNVFVDVPSIEMIEEDINGLADSVNKEIYEICEQYSKEAKYHNIDLQQEKIITFKNVLGEDYINIVNADIQTQIEQRMNSGEIFFSPEERGFAGISDNTKFYMNEVGNLIIVFDK